MKKEVQSILNSEEGMLEMTRAAKLIRWTRNALGDKVDMLKLSVEAVPGYLSRDYEIKARDWQGVVKEAAEAVKTYHKEAAEKIASEILNGHI